MLVQHAYMTLTVMYVWVRDRLLPRDRAVQRHDVLQLLPEQLQELPDVLHTGPVLPQLLLPNTGSMNDVRPPPLPEEKWFGLISRPAVVSI